ncbi:hypothetical protein PG984_004657 [Apiospora sp. TS-2023a]
MASRVFSSSQNTRSTTLSSTQSRSTRNIPKFSLEVNHCPTINPLRLITNTMSSTQANHGSVGYGHPASAPSSDKKNSKKQGRKSSKSSKKKQQSDALLGVGSQFDDDQGGSAGSSDHYPQDLVIN